MGTRSFLVSLAPFALAAAMGARAEDGGGTARLSYFGRSSVKIVTASGYVVYVDPYAPGDYSAPADLVSVTHGHGDHNDVTKTTRSPGAKIVAPAGAVHGVPSVPISEGEAQRYGPVEVRAVPAANRNHPRGTGVGYILSFDGIVVYHAGDTSYLDEMKALAKYKIGWALLCCDGYYNMGADEAARVAAAVGAKRTVPIHSSKDGLFDATVVRSVKAAELIVLSPGDSVALVP